MSDQNEQKQKQEQERERPDFGLGGRFGLTIDETKITVIRRPENRHLDNPPADPEPPEAA